MMLRVGVVAVLGLTLVGSAVAAETVFRCEGKDGRVTYSDAPCPSDSRAARRLEEGPTVSIPSGKNAGRDARDAGQMSRSKADPLAENRQLEEQIAASRRECSDLAQRVQYAKQDLDLAAPNQRSTAELALRRAQDQFALYCPRR
jgi:hypothetical protein